MSLEMSPLSDESLMEELVSERPQEEPYFVPEIVVIGHLMDANGCAAGEVKALPHEEWSNFLAGWR